VNEILRIRIMSAKAQREETGESLRTQNGDYLH
jgi:hypothetical protein